MKNVGEVLGEDPDGKPMCMVGIDGDFNERMVRVDLGPLVAYLTPGTARTLGSALLRFAEAIEPYEETEDIH
jgi:hypothetical protein